MKCWNCLQENSKKAHHCESCSQALEPNAAQKIAGSRNLDYLLKELDNWDFIDSDARTKLETVYRTRQKRLKELNDNTRTEWPETDWLSSPPPIPTIEPVSSENEVSEPQNDELKAATPGEEDSKETESLESECTPSEKVEVTAPAFVPLTPTTAIEPATPPQPGYFDSLVGEADIRWFHTLGALLVVAAVVGWLRASWDSYGKLMTGILIATSPVAMHFISQKLKKSVPLSSRLLAILANVLTPPALLALDIFGMLPAGVSSAHYWTFSLLVSAAILSFQAQSTREKVPLYLGALSCVMAGWSQGSLTTASLSLAIGFAFARDWGEEDEVWLQLRRQVSFYAGSFGALATLTLFNTSHHPTIPIFAFTAALLFTSLPTLTGQEQQNSQSRIILQAALAVVGSILMRTVLDLPPGGVALYLLFCSALFLTVKPDSKFCQASVNLASLMGFLGLAIGFFGNLGQVFTPDQSPKDALLRLLFAALGSVYFLGVSRKQTSESSAQPLILASALCLLGGWVHFTLFVTPPTKLEGLLPVALSLVVFQALLLAGTRKLRQREVKVVWSLSLPLLVFTAVLTFLGQILTPATELGWSLVLATHSLLAFSWERGWLAGRPDASSKEYNLIFVLLPRIVLATAALSLCQSAYVPHAQLKLAFGLTATTLGTFFLKGRYQNASWEGAWLLFLSSFAVFHEPGQLLAAAAASHLLAFTVSKRKVASLALSCGFGAMVLVMVGRTLPLPVLFLPALAFAAATILKAKDDQTWQDVGKARWGFTALLSVVIIQAVPFQTGSPQNLLYCAALGLFAGFCAKIWQGHKYPKLLRLIDITTGPTLMVVLFVWSLNQSTYETALLALLGSGAIALFSTDKNKTQVASGLALLGVAQGFTTAHFWFDSIVLSVGIVLFELYGAVSKKKTPQLAHLIVLAVALLQNYSVLWPNGVETALTIASLILAVSAVRTDENLVAAISTCMFLGKIDGFMQDAQVDFRVRLIPTALVLIGSSLWRFHSEREWPKPALQLGLSLMVAPSLLQFAGGFHKWENFVWTLTIGAAYIGLHFLLKTDLKRIFRQAGGYTLAAWAAVSLTRAALSLPWQAGTLVVGLLLVGAGVVVEKKRRQSVENSSASH